MAASKGDEEVPASFRRALSSLRKARVRAEVTLEEAPAPHRLAPYAAAVSAEVRTAEVDKSDDPDEEVATGRLVLLHDPAAPAAWDGTMRLVAYVRAALEPEMAVDPLLGAVAWTWLTEALTDHDAAYRRASGTVTRVTSESFGTLAHQRPDAQVEIRASWTPIDLNLDRHVAAWADVCCMAAGLPPLPPGVSALPSRSGR
jgi:hypothetical protein